MYIFLETCKILIYYEYSIKIISFVKIYFDFSFFSGAFKILLIIKWNEFFNNSEENTMYQDDFLLEDVMESIKMFKSPWRELLFKTLHSAPITTNHYAIKIVQNFTCKLLTIYKKQESNIDAIRANK